MTLSELAIYRSIFRNSIDAFIIVDTNSGKILKTNLSAKRILGYDESELIGKHFNILFPSSDSDEGKKDVLFRLTINDGVIKQKFLSREGEELYLEMTIDIISWIEGDALLITIRNINERLKAEENLHKALKTLEILSTTDPLTELDNRRSLIKKISYESYRFERSSNPFVIIICDIDNYKAVNDSYGHNAGDFVLKEISSILKTTLRKQDVVGRWGGDEFLLLLPQTNLKGGKILAEAIRRKVEKKSFQFSDIELRITMTFGLASFRQSETIDECISRADVALYNGKRSGKNVTVTAET